MSESTENPAWDNIFQKLEKAMNDLSELYKEVELEFGEHRDDEYLCSIQIERASEHLGDAQEHWRKAFNSVKYHHSPQAEEDRKRLEETVKEMTEKAKRRLAGPL